MSLDGELNSYKKDLEITCNIMQYSPYQSNKAKNHADG